MKQTQHIMGMPVSIDIIDRASSKAYDEAFAFFRHVDGVFSTYKPESEISKINRGELPESAYSGDMKTVLALSEETKKQTGGYFNIRTPNGTLDPSGLVKGWAIYQAARRLSRGGFQNFYIEAGGDIQAEGKNSEGKPWSVGIRNPFNTGEIVQALTISGRGVATSGTYERGEHIYNPHHGKNGTPHEIISLTVIGPNVYEADRFATAAFAMGRNGIHFIEKLGGFEGYMIDKHGIGTETTGLHAYKM